MSGEIGSLASLNAQPGDVIEYTAIGEPMFKAEAFTFGGWVDGVPYASDHVLGSEDECLRTDAKAVFKMLRRAAPTGPVRTVTRKEIVPGSYGGVEVTHVDYATEARGANVCIRIDNGFGPDSLRAAIATLAEIADALEASTQ